MSFGCVQIRGLASAMGTFGVFNVILFVLLCCSSASGPRVVIGQSAQCYFMGLYRRCALTAGVTHLFTCDVAVSVPTPEPFVAGESVRPLSFLRYGGRVGQVGRESLALLAWHSANNTRIGKHRYETTKKRKLQNESFASSPLLVLNQFE